MSVTPTTPVQVLETRSSSASSHSPTTTPLSSSSPPLKRPVLEDSPTRGPYTPIQPIITLMTPTPPPSMTRPQVESPSDNKSNRKWRASPLTTEPTTSSNVTVQNQAQSSIPPPSSSLPKESTLSSQSQLSPTIVTPTSAVSAACSTNIPNPLQTTNVYINGLPPNFKAEQLYALTSQFGTVLSCRTFTRQLSDHPSGYGFVLFETLESAQQCIEVLRSHHNLHPTFAKQAHKINRVPMGYASPNLAMAQPLMNLIANMNMNTNMNMNSINAGVNNMATEGVPTGADIYIEGLPISVDVPTLRTILAPFVIRSSRFFADTRMQPPQLVAFVQLESRAAAQEVHAKLHGRTIRGYSGRLQVSFADDVATEHTNVQQEWPVTSPNPNAKVSSGLPMSAYPDPFADPEDMTSRLQGLYAQQQAFMSPISGQGEGQVQNLISMDSLSRQTASYPRFDAGSSPTVPAPLQPLSATLYELQMQLENLRPLLVAFNANPNVNANVNAAVSPTPARQGTFSSDSNAYHDKKTGGGGGGEKAVGPGSAALNPLANSYTATGTIQARTQTTAAYGLGASLFPHPSAGGGAVTGQRQLQGMSGKNAGSAGGTTVGGARFEL
ncbi:hypothetical protein BU17DRAFT_82702 [Hysterangium stoloniferum]|nr:hypothetical protein BU17DRAFT_82702 [Hysterangium stoloniferum]